MQYINKKAEKPNVKMLKQINMKMSFSWKEEVPNTQLVLK